MQAVTAKGQTPASNSPTDIAAAIGKISTLSESLYFKWYAKDPTVYLEEYINGSKTSTISGPYYSYDGEGVLTTPLGNMYYSYGWCITLTSNIYYQANSLSASKTYLASGKVLKLPGTYTSSSTYFITFA